MQVPCLVHSWYQNEAGEPRLGSQYSFIKVRVEGE